jgi:hypothetical protein
MLKTRVNSLKLYKDRSGENQEMMTANSAFWRDLADQFLALQDRLRPASATDDLMYITLENLAKRGASKIAGAGASDLLAIWLEALGKERLPFSPSGQSKKVLSAAEYSQSLTKDTFAGMGRASATFCKQLEAQALQAEFEDQGRSASRHQRRPIEKSRRGATLSKKPAFCAKNESYPLATVAEVPRPALTSASPAVPQEPKPTEVAPAQPEEANVSEALELFFAWWPSSSFPSPGLPDVVQNFKSAHRILTANGFLIVADPENVTGDGKSWVLECKPTSKLPKDAAPAHLARQYLALEGVKTDEIVLLDESDRTLLVCLSPPPQPVTSVERQEESLTKRRTKLLQKLYGADVANLSRVSSAAVIKEWKDAHNGAAPPMDYVVRETMKQAREALGVTPTRHTGPLQPANHGTFANWARSHSIRQSAPLSPFEAKVGKLMVEARVECRTKYLPQTEIIEIAALLDDEEFPVRDNLERAASHSMAKYNQQHPAVAIKSWKTALRHPEFRHAVRKRFSRAEEKYRKATPSVLDLSAGTPRTTI